MIRRSLLAAMILIAPLAACGKKERPYRVADLAASRTTTIGINSYLWRAALDTVSFMPLVQTDSNGGVIVTDWYANPSSPGERMKLTVTILDQDLRADALRVAASRQVQQGGSWIDVPVQAATVQKLPTLRTNIEKKETNDAVDAAAAATAAPPKKDDEKKK